MMIDCRMCLLAHDDRYLCDAVRDLLNAMYARGDRNTMPTIEFTGEPLPGPVVPDAESAAAEPCGDQLLSQFVVQAGMIPAGSVTYPALVITGRAPDDRPLPQWIYAADERQIRAGAKLVADMADLAIRQARKANGNR